MRLVLLGPPGLGKGTQSALLEEKFGAKHVSSGDMLRNAVESRNPAGLAAESYMKSGDLVPDKIMTTVLGDVLQSREAARGFILDGFPRTKAQAVALTNLLSDLGLHLDAVVALSGDLDEVLRRISGRRVCRSCGAVFNLHEMGDEQLERCRICGGALYQREDDKPETVKHRFQVYHERTEPLIEYYRENGLLRMVDGVAGKDDVFRRITAMLSSAETARGGSGLPEEENRDQSSTSNPPSSS